MPPCDQIPPERIVTGDAFRRLDEHGALLTIAIAQWMTRDDSKPGADARRAASTAMTEIDAMLAGLHQLRARLLSEIRADDDATAARADAILAAAREAAQAPADPEAWAFR